MTDRELLELAAKAAGWTGWRSKHGYWNVESPEGEKTTHCHNWNAYCPDTGEKLREPTFADAIAETNWNPITDDGDALRLAVKLRLHAKHFMPLERMDFDSPLHGMVEVWQEGGEDPLHVEYFDQGDDRLIVTRRAIVRAAAEIGRNMK